MALVGDITSLNLLVGFILSINVRPMKKVSSLVFDFCVAWEPSSTHRDHYSASVVFDITGHTVCFQLITYEGIHQFDFSVKISNLAI